MATVKAILAIAVTTLIEGLRNRVLMIALAFAVALIALSISTAAISIEEQARLIIDVGLGASSALGSLIAVALSIGSFGRELQLRTAYPVLARPLPRWAFVLGKYLGLWVTSALIVSLMMLATTLAVVVFGAELPQAFQMSLYLLWLEMAVVVALALLFSCFTTPLLAAAYSIGLIIAGNLTGTIADLALRMEEQHPIGSSVLRILYHVLPEIERLSLRTQAANGLAVPPTFLGWATLYALAYSLTALLLAMMLFTRRRAI